LAAAYCHFIQMQAPQATHEFKSWKDFARKRGIEIPS